MLILKTSALYSCGWYLQDNWIAHQDDFNQLLAELNNCHGQGETGRFMLGSIRCWKLNRVSILCLKKVPEAQFVMQIIFWIRLRTPKITGSQRMCCHPWAFVDLSGSVFLSALKERLFLEERKHKIFTLFISSGITVFGMLSLTCS